jgi:hypothetical protein
MNGLELLRLSRDPAVTARSVDTMTRAAQRGAASRSNCWPSPGSSPCGRKRTMWRA